VQSGRESRQLLTAARIEAENCGPLGSVENRALVRGQIDPVTALDLGSDGPSVKQIPVSIEFQKSMTAARLSHVGIAGIVEHDGFRFAVVPASKISDQTAATTELAHCVGGEIGYIKRIKGIEGHARNRPTLART